jgi:hypothetical protein
MSAAPLPTLDALLSALDDLSHSERIREATALARIHAQDPALPPRLGQLLAGDHYPASLAVAMAQALRHRATLVAALDHRSLTVRRLAVDSLTRVLDPVPEDISSLVHTVAPALRRALLKGLVRRGQRAAGRLLFPEVLARYGPREAAVLLPVLEDSTLRAALPGLAHAVGNWRGLLHRHPEVVRARLLADLDAAAPRERPGVWQQYAGLVHALAELQGAALLDLLDRFGDTCPAHLLLPRLGELTRVDPARLIALLERPQLRDLLVRQGLPRRLLNQLWRCDDEQRARLGRLLVTRPELLAPLLLRLAPGRREALVDAIFRDQERATRVWPDAFLDALPTSLQRREAARMLTLPVIEADPERSQALAAYLDFAAARPLLQAKLRAADADERGRAIARTIACAARETSRPHGDREALTGALNQLLPRLKNDQDPVRLAAFAALALVAPGRYRDADIPALQGLVTAAIEARDTSHQTRQHIQQLAFRLLRTHAVAAGEPLFAAGLGFLQQLAVQSASLVLPDLSRGLPRRSAPAIVEALRPRLAAASERDRPHIILALATALGRRGWGLAALDQLLGSLRTAKPEAIAARALTLLLADPKQRDERVRELIAWDVSVITLQPVLMHLHLRRQAWLDPFLAATPIRGRFRDGKTIHVLPVQSGFARWLPRQQRAYVALLARAGSDRGHAHWTRAAVIARIAHLPTTTVADFTPYLESHEVPVIEAALGALVWTDDPVAALPVLLQHLDGDRARVAMYALPRVARFVDAATLTPILIDLITGDGRKVTVRKEALRLLGEHRSPASVPALQRALAQEGLHKDVAIAVGHAARSLLDDPRALELLATLARSPEPDVARSILDPRPEQLPAAARPGYAALVLGLTRHPDLTTRRAATAALPIWSSGQEAVIADSLVAVLLDLETGDTWSEAATALVALDSDGAASPALIRGAAELAVLATRRRPDPRRDLPARQRLLALLARVQARPRAQRLPLRATHDAIARALVDDDLWPYAAALRLCALDLAAADAETTLHAIATDARADLFLGELVAAFHACVTEARAQLDPAILLALAARLDHGLATVARLAVVLVVAAGTHTGWPAPACQALAALREHGDPRVRHAARQAFTRPETPSPTASPVLPDDD